MEFVEYDKQKEISTIKLSNEELVDINSVFLYIASTWSRHDQTILFGVDESKLNRIISNINTILDGVGKANC